MLGMSFGELVVIVAAAAWVFGPNELPRVARAAGRLTGQATGFLYRTRARLFQFAEETEMTKLHQEVQATMYQLNAIRSELQGGINIFQPGPLAQRVLSVTPMPGQTEMDASAASQPWAAGAAAGSEAAAAAGQAPLQAAQQAPFVPPSMLGSFAASAVAAAPAMQQQQQAQQVHQAQRSQAMAAMDDGEQHPATVPVSAVAAGWAPDRSGRAPTGSEVLLDALAEELIAAQVLRFQQQQMMQQQQQAAARQQAAAQQRGRRAPQAAAAAEQAAAPQQQGAAEK